MSDHGPTMPPGLPPLPALSHRGVGFRVWQDLSPGGRHAWRWALVEGFREPREAKDHGGASSAEEATVKALAACEARARSAARLGRR